MRKSKAAGSGQGHVLGGIGREEPESGFGTISAFCLEHEAHRE